MTGKVDNIAFPSSSKSEAGGQLDELLCFVSDCQGAYGWMYLPCDDEEAGNVGT